MDIFIDKYQCLEEVIPSFYEPPMALFAGCRVSSFEPFTASVTVYVSQRREADVDLALRLNVLALCAAFLFVGAVLLGAF